MGGVLLPPVAFSFVLDSLHAGLDVGLGARIGLALQACLLVPLLVRHTAAAAPEDSGV